MIQAAPPQARANKELYYAWLTSNGWPREVAWDEMVKAFGKPPTKQEQADAAARAQQGAQLRQVGGAVAGTALTGWGMREFPTGAPDWYKSMGLPGTYDAPSITAPTSGGPIQGPVNAFSGGSNLPDISPTLDYANPELMQQTSALAGDKLQLVPPEALSDPGFMSNVDWGKVGQGAAGAAQLFAAYQAYKGGDKPGAAIYGASGAAQLAASGALGASAQTQLASLAPDYLIPGLGGAAAAYGAYKTAEMTGNMGAGARRDNMAGIGGASAGLSAGMAIGGALGPIGMVAGALIGYAASKYFGSKKTTEQMLRDGVRKSLRKAGVLDDKFQGTLADGSGYDFGKDGSTLKWKELDKVVAANPNSWGQALEMSQALAVSYGLTGKKNGNVGVMYAKAAVSNAGDDPEKAAANMRHFAGQQGFTMDAFKQQLDKAKEESQLSQFQYDSYMNGAIKLLGGAGAAGAGGASVANKMALVRPKKGEVQRVSAGLYRDDTGKLRGSATMRGALEKAYGKTKAKA